MEQLAGSRMALGKSRTKVAGFAPKSGAGLLSAQAGTCQGFDLAGREHHTFPDLP